MSPDLRDAMDEIQENDWAFTIISFELERLGKQVESLQQENERLRESLNLTVGSLEEWGLTGGSKNWIEVLKFARRALQERTD